MDRRHELHDELKQLLGSNEVHFQPPESKKLSYPCFIYRRARTENLRADNRSYHQFDKYGLTYLTHDPDDPMIRTVPEHFPMCELVQTNAKDYLNQYHYDLYF